MPYKHNAERRHHISNMKLQVTNWAEYEVGLRRRGSLRLWVTEAAIDAWHAAPHSTPGGQATYFDIAIQTLPVLRTAFKLPLRQGEGLMTSLVELIGCELDRARPHDGQPPCDQDAIDRYRGCARGAAARGDP